MSIQAATAVLGIRGAALTVAERYVLLVYAVHARQPDDAQAPLEAWPTASTVAAETGLSREHVQRSLASLQGHGLLRQTGAKRGRANVYQVSLRRIQHLCAQVTPVPAPAAVVCAEVTPTCDATSQHAVTSDHTEREGEREGERTTSATADAADAPDPAHVVATAVYDATAGAYPFMGARKIAGWAIRRKGAAPEAVTDAMVRMYRAGRPLTQALLGQVLDGLVPLNGPRTAAAAADRTAHRDAWTGDGGGFFTGGVR